MLDHHFGVWFVKERERRERDFRKGRGREHVCRCLGSLALYWLLLWNEVCNSEQQSSPFVPFHLQPSTPTSDRLVGLVVRCPPREWKTRSSNPACAGVFSGSSHTSDSKIATPVATLPGAWRYRVSAGTGQPGVSILWLGEVESVICNFYLSVAARRLVWEDPSLRYTSLLLGR